MVFDKTGTLTRGRPVLQPQVGLDSAALALAAALAGASRHPLARALTAAFPGVPLASGVEEVPGCGLRRLTPAGEVRLGSRAWCGVEDQPAAALPELWLKAPGRLPTRFAFDDPLRADAAAVIVAALAARGLDDRAAVRRPRAGGRGGRRRGSAIAALAGGLRAGG